MNPDTVLFGGPIGRSIPTPWYQKWSSFLREATRYKVALPMFESHAGRIDVARSILIETGKQNPNVKWLISADTDVVLDTATGMTADKLLEILDADADSGWGFINGLTFDKFGHPQLQATTEGWADAVRHEPMNGVLGFAGGFFAVSRAALDAVQPVAEVELANWTEEPQRLKLYCRMGQNFTEDWDLCQTFLKSGVRITCDPRIPAGHIKDVEQYPDPAFWDVSRRQAIKVLAQLEAEKAHGRPAPEKGDGEKPAP